MKAKREPRTSIIIHLLNTLKNIWRNSLIGNLDSIIIDNRVNWGGKENYKDDDMDGDEVWMKSVVQIRVVEGGGEKGKGVDGREKRKS